MIRGNSFIRKSISTVLATALTVSALAALPGAPAMKTLAAGGTGASSGNGAASSYDSTSTERLATNYTHVSAGYTAPVYTGEPVILSMEEGAADEATAAFLTSDNRGYEGGAVADVAHGDELTLKASVPQTAQYRIGFDYLSYDASILPIELSFAVDGEYPFYEARSLAFETTWISEGEADIDRYGNEIVSLPDKKIRWEHKDLGDASYRYSGALLVELTAGEHEFNIGVREGTLLLGNITLCAPEVIPEYKGSEAAPGAELITIEAEDFTERSHSSIHAVGEFDNALYPLSPKEKVLNVIDEDSFNEAGQRVTYEFTAEKAGYYRLAMNYRQSEKNDFPVFADIRVDGEIPSTAFSDYPIKASAGYTLSSFTDEQGEKLSVYLEEGTHTVSLTISADPLRYALEEADEIMSGISDLSLEIKKVAGTGKDKYRDLKLTRYIPDVQTRLLDWVERLYAVTTAADPYVGADKPKDVAAFSYLLIAADQLNTLAEEPDELVYRVDELATSVNSINTQIANFVDLIGDNDLAIDRIYLYQDDAKLPKKPGLFARLWMNIKRFFLSFFGQSYSASNVDETHIQVWVNRPRQYVEIMQKMIDEDFTKKTGIQVDLSLMTDAQKLILSNASGDTPDIATGINYSIPFDMAIRGALVDLTQFDNYKEVFGRYSDGLLVPSVVGEGLYSLPETMNFYVCFTRTDILEKLGLTPPDTMEELIGMLPDLQMRGLNVYYPTAPMLAMRNFHGTTPLIYQNGGELYGETALDIESDSEATVEGFTELTELFTIYDLPVDVPNFYQHFRNGDLPIGIADFNSYNLILNAAPEIANSWEISLVPGTVDEETGEVLRYMSGGAESTV
ncbi:MAG: extracellular solute-binding protein, partial [Lachnospiraceae bacterium]|nr:extracellular solute-binding protein [Lachnospiraceae bacterium]